MNTFNEPHYSMYATAMTCRRTHATLIMQKCATAMTCRRTLIFAFKKMQLLEKLE